MEYCGGGDLSVQVSKRKKSNTPYNENEIKNILYQIAIALQHCHSQNILHRDVKTSNIFISTTNNRIKLGDFGVSRVLNTDMSMAETQIGTPYYISPEICKGQSYSFKSDIWSLGCVMYELMNLQRPFDGNHIASLVMAITNGKFKPLRNSLVFHFNTSHSSFTFYSHNFYFIITNINHAFLLFTFSNCLSTINPSSY